MEKIDSVRGWFGDGATPEELEKMEKQKKINEKISRIRFLAGNILFITLAICGVVSIIQLTLIGIYYAIVAYF